MNKWILWGGGKCPVSASVVIDTRTRNGQAFLGTSRGCTGAIRWNHYGNDWDIVAYRLSTQEEAYEETDKPIEGEIRTFETGATRNVETGKLDYEGFLSPLVIERFAEYMDKHRVQADGNIRDADNWQRGMPKDSYIKSGWRHHMDWWKEHRGIKTEAGIEDALCAIIFNAQGYLLEHLKSKE